MQQKEGRKGGFGHLGEYLKSRRVGKTSCQNSAGRVAVDAAKPVSDMRSPTWLEASLLTKVCCDKGWFSAG
jgi:hypothetical protein